ISGGDGGTGAAPLSSMKHAGLPWELGLVDAHRRLVELGLRDEVRLRVDGGLSTPRDLVMAALLGAEEFGLRKLLLVAQGCIMARVCEKNRCPTGIATHDPRFKAKYKGSPQHVVTLLRWLADGVRRLLARLGARSLQEIVGQRQWLEAAPAHGALVAARHIDIGPMHAPVPWMRSGPVPAPTGGWSAHEQELIEAVRLQLEATGRAEVERSVGNQDRAVGTGLAGELARRAARVRAVHRREPERPRASPFPAPDSIRLRLHGSAGQGFAAFTTEGASIELRGEANDGVAKSMSGGRVIVRPPEASHFLAEDNVISGNGALYGATGGTIYVHGRAGDRFAVRNSGATAVVEGAGLHACEYMTGGTVVILGPVMANAGAGMTGGRLFLPAEHRAQLNEEYVIASALEDDGEHERLRALLGDYLRATGSRTARALLADPAAIGHRLLRVWPRAALPMDQARALG
ncbi:MAG: glutamate synthase subunit alpha, partial [Myxococcales bacterium]|nr:glutamate synthase subunit alpha [Myxococcales bacterium]